MQAKQNRSDDGPLLAPGARRETAGARLGLGLAVGVIGVVALSGAAWWGAAAAGVAAWLAPLVAGGSGRRRAAREIEELADERSRTIFEALGEGVLVVDRHGHVMAANPAARRALRRPSMEPRGCLLWDALSSDLSPRAREAWQALTERDGDEGALPMIRYCGLSSKDRVFDLTAVQATSSRTGEDFGTVFLLVDCTRAHELQRIKDRFLSSVSHELRTPLTNICAFAEILKGIGPGENEEWSEFLRVIHQEGVELSDLVDAMFDYLQLESGAASFVSSTFDATKTTRLAVERLRPRARSRGVEIDFVVNGDPPELHADVARLDQLVGHLLDNAVKFCPESGRIRVVVGCREEGWELRIEDDGPGVPFGDREAVFEKFHQLQCSTNGKPEGTGIGLAISRAIVARFGGLIWCEDSEMGGACFVVLLPGVNQPKLAGFAAGTGAGGGF